MSDVLSAVAAAIRDHVTAEPVSDGYHDPSCQIDPQSVMDAARAALAAAFQWQRIETAPNDGTDVLIFPPMTVALKTPDAWTDGTGATLHPTHWMPLPPPPKPPRSRSG